MVFLKKFKRLMEIELKDLKKKERPSNALLTYSVCVDGKKACGWKGWYLESATSKDTNDFNDELPIVDRQICPNCGRDLYRTGASIYFGKLRKKHPKRLKNYKIAPIRYR